MHLMDLRHRGLLQAEARVDVVDLFNALGSCGPRGSEASDPIPIWAPPPPPLLPSWKLHCPNPKPGPSPTPNVCPGRCLSRPSAATISWFFFLRRHEYPPWRCCELHSGENPGETIPQSAYPKCTPLPTGDWCTQQPHGCCTPEQLERLCVNGCVVRGTIGMPRPMQPIKRQKINRQ